MSSLGFQISGLHNVDGFRPLLSIGWTGSDLDDFIPNEQIYTGVRYCFVTLGKSVDTYELVLPHFEASDARARCLKVAMQVPVGYCIVDEFDTLISPVSILRRILDDIMATKLKEFEGYYSYRGGETPVFETRDISKYVNKYHLKPVWGRHYEMTPSREKAKISVDDSEIDNVAAQLASSPASEKYKSIEIGPFGSNVSSIPVPPTDIPNMVTVKIKGHIGNDDTIGLTNDNPYRATSQKAGFDPVIFESAEVEIVRSKIIEAALKGELDFEGQGVSYKISPSTGEVLVNFHPDERIETFTVELETTKKSKVDESFTNDLAYGNDDYLKGGKLKFKGQNIVEFISRFEKEPKALAQAFYFKTSNQYSIQEAHIKGNTIKVVVVDLTDDKKNKGAAKRKESSKKYCLIKFSIPREGDKPMYYTDVTIHEKDGNIIKQTLVRNIELTATKDEFNGAIPYEGSSVDLPTITIGYPVLYKVGTTEVSRSDKGIIIEGRFEKKRNGLLRFFDIFRYKPVGIAWNILRISIISLLYIIVFAGGMALAWWQHESIDKLLGIPNTENVDGSTPPDNNATPPPSEQTVKEVPTDTINKLNTDSI